MFVELYSKELSRIGGKGDGQAVLVRGYFGSWNVNGNVAGPRDLTCEARAILRDAGAIQHVQFVVGRRAQSFAALAYDYAARGAGKLAAAIVRQRSAALQQAVQKDFAFAQGYGVMLHINQTSRIVQRSSAQK